MTKIGFRGGKEMKSLSAVVIVGLFLLSAFAGCIERDTTESETIDLTGTWNGNWQRSDGGEEGTLTAYLSQTGSSLSGNMIFTSTTYSYSKDTTISGSVKGNKVALGTATGSDGSTVTIDFEGTISEDGNQMSGTYSMSTGYTGTWTATR